MLHYVANLGLVLKKGFSEAQSLFFILTGIAV